MEWTADVSAGDWLRDRLDDEEAWGTSMHGVVPRGFAAYARIFHPATRSRPVGVEWPRAPYSDQRVWNAFHAEHADVEIVDERVSWAMTAAAMGTTMHPLSSWARVAGVGRDGEFENDPQDAAGWRYQAPETGGMPADLLAVLASTLAAHTATPGEGGVAVWEGHGGLVGFTGVSPSRVFFGFDDQSASPAFARHRAMLGRSIKDRFNNVFRKETWQEGILPREISDGPRLELPFRAHVLFRGGVAELADPDWVLRAPWRDRIAEERGFPPDALTPSMIWPADRAWTSVTEIDEDSTIVAGSRALVDALVANPQLEALEISEGSSLASGADGTAEPRGIDE